MYYFVNFLLTIFFTLMFLFFGWIIIWKCYLKKKKIVIELLNIKDGKINL